MELLDDISNEAAASLTGVMIAAIASAIDQAALTADGTGNGPTGLFYDADVNHTTLGAGADGGPLTNYADLLAAIFAVRARNLKPSAAIYSERTALEYASLVDNTGQPLNAPKPVAELPQFSTTAVPNDLTEGVSTDASFLAVGKFDQLAIGYRPQIGVRAEVGQINADSLTRSFVAFCRADVAVLRPAAFEIVDGVIAAA
jgi:HK97 family phage major capsid protein